jgi:uncharacterized protein YkwD
VRRLLVVAVFGILVVSLLGQTAPPAPGSEVTDEEKVFVELTNKEREKAKLPPYKINATLCRIARAHSENMARQEKMNHELDGKNPTRRINESGYPWQRVGENIARAEDNTPEEVMLGWMESPHHRDNILHKEFTEIGVGLARKGKDTYYTQVFAKPRR